MSNPTEHRCYSCTRQVMLEEITRLDEQVASLQKYKLKYKKCKSKQEKVQSQVSTLNLAVSKMLNEL